MKKPLTMLLILAAWAAVLSAQVVLPASGRLAGPLDPSQSQLGDEFFNFPPELGQRPRPGESPLSGWLAITFADPADVLPGSCPLPIVAPGDQVYFFLEFDSAGPTDRWAFENGQGWLLDRNRAFSNPLGFNCGVLNLATGLVDAITLNPIFQNSTIAQVNRNNRIPFAFPPTYPPPPLPPLPPPLEPPPELLEPGFIFNDALFLYTPDGRIDGFQFFGKTIVPVGLVAVANPILPQPIFPLQAFGPNGEFYFAVPYECLATSAFCPDQDDSPNGMQLPLEAFFRPYFALGSARLREVDVERTVAPCEPWRRYDAVMVAVGHRLYQMGGVGAGGSVNGRVDIYDHDLDRWLPGPPLPIPVTQAQGAAIGSRIYVYGGRDAGGQITSALQILDTATGTWTPGPDGPIPVANGVAAAIADALYVTSGKTAGDPAHFDYNKAVIAYHPPGFTAPPGWEELPVNLPSFVEGASVVALGAEIYVLGGRKLDPIAGVESVTREVVVFSAVNNTVKEGPEMSWGVHEANASLAANHVYVMGGRRKLHGPATAGVQTMILGGERWFQDRPLPLPVASASAAVLLDEIYLSGGRTTRGDRFPGPVVRAVQVLDPGQGWATCGSRPVFNADDLANSASLSVGSPTLSPGSLAVLTGYHFGGPAVAPAGADVPTQLAGIRITVDGLDAPILAVSPRRVDFQVPYGVSPGIAKIVVRRHGRAEPPIRYTIDEVSPGLFVETYGETRERLFLDRAPALACLPDGTLNFPPNPVEHGEVIILQATGLGPVTPPLANGERAGAGVTADFPVTVRIDGIVSTVDSVTLAEGEVGVYEIRARVPAGSRAFNLIPVDVEVAGVTSNEAAIAVATSPMTPRPLPCRRPIPVGSQ